MTASFRAIILGLGVTALAVAPLPANAAALPPIAALAQADSGAVPQPIHGYHCERLYGPSPWGLTMHNNPEACGEVYYDAPDYSDDYYDDGPRFDLDIYVGPGSHYGGHRKGHGKRYRRDGREVGDHGGH